MKRKTATGGIVLVKGSMIVAILMIFCVMAVSSFASQKTASIELFSERIVSKDPILLFHIAKIDGSDQRMVELIGNIPVGRIPSHGQKRIIQRSGILRKIKEKSEWNVHVVFKGPKKVTVSKAGRIVSPERIESEVRKTIREKMPWNEKNVRFKVKEFHKQVFLPEGDLKIVVTPLKKEDFIGSVTVSVAFYVNSLLEKRMWVNTSLEVLKEVCVTKRPIGRDQLVSEKDVELKKISVEDSVRGFFTEMKDVVGKRAKRMIAPHSVITDSLVEMPPVVRKGETVTILAESDLIKVTSRGIIKEEGGRGELIRVMNFGSNKIIEAHVVGPGLVRVKF